MGLSREVLRYGVSGKILEPCNCSERRLEIGPVFDDNRQGFIEIHLKITGVSNSLGRVIPAVLGWRVANDSQLE